MSGKKLHIGSRGWLYPHWAGTFYPDDLPDEWRFSYYSNEFSCVLVPCEYWLNAGHAEVEQWIDGCGDNFTFYVEIDLAGDVARQLSLATVLLPQMSAVVMKGPADYDAQQFPQQVGEIVQLIGDKVPLYCCDTCPRVANHSPNIGKILTFTDRGNNEKPTNNIDDSRLVGSDYIAFLISSEAHSIMQLKSHIETLIRCGTGSVCQALFVAGDYPDLDQLRQASQLYALMA